VYRKPCPDLLYAFVIVRLDRRELVWINVTTNPTAEWIACQITEAFPWDDAPQYLIRDRDKIIGVLRHHHIGDHRLRRQAAFDQPRRCRGLDHAGIETKPRLTVPKVAERNL
jgi:hypothetical protein